MNTLQPASQALTPADRRVLTNASCQLARYDLLTETEDFVLEAQVLASALSEPLRRSLLTFRRFGHPSGAMLIREVPLGIVPSTPNLREAATADARAASSALSVLVALLGDQYGFRPELGGAIVQDMVPLRGFETQQISVSSSVDLKTHVEMAFSPFRADYVALLCVRQDHDRRAATTLSSIEGMLPRLDGCAIEVLREHRFRTKVDASFLIGDNRTEDVWVDPIPVFEGAAHRPRLRVDFAETEGKDAVAADALAALSRAALEPQTRVRLRAGDLLIIDNNRALHGRTPFVPRYDGRDRWILRTFITKDLRRSECVRPHDGRIVEPDYGDARPANRARPVGASDVSFPSGSVAGDQAVETRDHPLVTQLRSDKVNQVGR